MKEKKIEKEKGERKRKKQYLKKKIERNTE